MTRIVAVHGIGQQFLGAESLHAIWFPAARDGLRLAGGDLDPADLAVAAYGDLFRPPGRPLAVDVPPLTAEDVEAGFDQDILAAWWAHAAEVDAGVIPPDARTLVRTPGAVQAALRALSGSTFFAGLAMRAMVYNLRQVRRYMTEVAVWTAVQARIEREVTARTRVIVGHSLGSVAAYEALCAHPEWPVRALITLGSPLGVRDLIFDRLRPPPAAAGQARGVWPPSVRHWTNVVDQGDVVALVKDLRPLFGDGVRGFVVHNGSHAHDVRPYLSAEQTGAAILEAVS